MLEPEHEGFAASPKLASTVRQKVPTVSSSGQQSELGVAECF